jgi:hypothetical protein
LTPDRAGLPWPGLPGRPGAPARLAGARDRADWPTLRETLIAWSEGGFNLLRAAERLHVHRNTLLYRLGKIEQLSARQMREPTQAIAMYLAALADLLDSPHETSGPRPERPVKPDDPQTMVPAPIGCRALRLR